MPRLPENVALASPVFLLFGDRQRLAVVALGAVVRLALACDPAQVVQDDRFVVHRFRVPGRRSALRCTAARPRPGRRAAGPPGPASALQMPGRAGRRRAASPRPSGRPRSRRHRFRRGCSGCRPRRRRASRHLASCPGPQSRHRPTSRCAPVPPSSRGTRGSAQGALPGRSTCRRLPGQPARRAGRSARTGWPRPPPGWAIRRPGGRRSCRRLCLRRRTCRA